MINNINSLVYNIWPPGILNLLNVKYLIVPESNFKHPLFEKINSSSMYYFGYLPKYDGNLIKVNIFENKNWLPRLFYTQSLEKLNSNEIHNKILQDSFNPELKSYVDNKNLEDSYSSIVYIFYPYVFLHYLFDDLFC